MPRVEYEIEILSKSFTDNRNGQRNGHTSSHKYLFQSQFFNFSKTLHTQIKGVTDQAKKIITTRYELLKGNKAWQIFWAYLLQCQIFVAC